jgi:hypothetical protein
VALPKVVPPGSVSVTVRLVAVLGPAFVTVRVYVNVAPAVTGSSESALAIDRSADAVEANGVGLLTKLSLEPLSNP